MEGIGLAIVGDPERACLEPVLFRTIKDTPRKLTPGIIDLHLAEQIDPERLVDRIEIAIYKRLSSGAGIEKVGTTGTGTQADGIGDVRVAWLVDSIHEFLLAVSSIKYEQGAGHRH